MNKQIDVWEIVGAKQKEDNTSLVVYRIANRDNNLISEVWLPASSRLSVGDRIKISVEVLYE